MNREEAKRRAEIMLAWANGKTLECSRPVCEGWRSLEDATNLSFDWKNADYRIKPKEFDYINWDHIDDQWNAIARDENGQVCLYRIPPEVYVGYWAIKGGAFPGYLSIRSFDSSFKLFSSYRQGNVPWDQSLVIRPGYENKN